MGLDQISGKDLSSSNSTVVGTLGTGVTTLGPVKRPAIGIEEGVLLLESEPGLVLCGRINMSTRSRSRKEKIERRTSLAASIDLAA